VQSVAVPLTKLRAQDRMAVRCVSADCRVLCAVSPLSGYSNAKCSVNYSQRLIAKFQRCGAGGWVGRCCVAAAGTVGCLSSKRALLYHKTFCVTHLESAACDMQTQLGKTVQPRTAANQSHTPALPRWFIRTLKFCLWTLRSRQGIM